MILPLLNPKDFLSLCSVNQGFYSSFHLEPTYWRVQTSTTFRIPINPLLLAEGGARWYWLYKKLRTQTIAYAWGSDSGHGSLGQEGHRPEPPAGLRARPLIRHRPIIRSTFSCPEPKEMHVPTDVGVIADLQCGGWSTSLLSSKGEIWSVGVLDAANGRMHGKPVSIFTKLEYGHLPDEGYPSIETFEPIKQFSSGRRHLLGLDEAGNVWFWNQILERGRKIEFLSPTLIGGDKATQVIAGWQTSTAFVPNQGIVYWRPPDGGDENPFPAINEKVVPHTGYTTNGSRRVGNDEDHSEHVGRVLAHIMLENYIVYITTTSRVFAFKVDVSELPFEVTSLSSSLTGYGPLLNIQGSFRRFAVFSSTGQVLTCDQDYLENWLSSLNNHLDLHSLDLNPPHHLQSHNLLPAPPLIPALQNTQVISLAFGDYHFHALHSTGDISSYGHEPGHSGAFGLGSNDCHVALLRGLIAPSRNPRFGRGGGGTRLSAQAWRSPRRIWFDQQRQDWIKELAESAGSKGWTNEVNPQPVPVAGDNAAQQEFPAAGLSEEEWAGVSEWVEQEGLAWYNTTPTTTDAVRSSPPPSHHPTRPQRQQTPSKQNPSSPSPSQPRDGIPAPWSCGPHPLTTKPPQPKPRNQPPPPLLPTTTTKADKCPALSPRPRQRQQLRSQSGDKSAIDTVIQGLDCPRSDSPAEGSCVAMETATRRGSGHWVCRRECLGARMESLHKLISVTIVLDEDGLEWEKRLVWRNNGGYYVFESAENRAGYRLELKRSKQATIWFLRLSCIALTAMSLWLFSSLLMSKSRGLPLSITCRSVLSVDQ